MISYLYGTPKSCNIINTLYVSIVELVHTHVHMSNHTLTHSYTATSFTEVVT